MTYYVALFSPETHKSFTESDQDVYGLSANQARKASKLRVGDKLICYMTKMSRWIGVLEVKSKPYEDDTPLFYDQNDPYIIRVKVEPIVWLTGDKTVPIHNEKVWDNLSFTRNLHRESIRWTGKIRQTLNRLSKEDGVFLEKILVQAGTSQDEEVYPFDQEEYDKLARSRHSVRRDEDTTVIVSVPEDTDVEEIEAEQSAEESTVRESIQIQALLAGIGAKMGMKIWLPNRDRSNVFSVWPGKNHPVLKILPLNYDQATLKTIEEIDVIWLSGRSIVRAFEVEHTTSIYSGILRMADLLALQPNIDIKLHIVAPLTRREKVFSEITRPVFSLLDRKPLADTCTYLSYESIRELSEFRHLQYMTDDVLDEYAESPE